MSALLEGFKDDGCIKGLFGGDSSSDDDEHVTENDSDVSIEKENNNLASPIEFSHYQSHHNGRVLDIKLETNKLKGIAHQLWPASVLFCQFLENHHATLVPRPHRTSVIELGAGVGLCGLFMSTVLRCRRCLLTDLAEALELLQKNIAHNTAPPSGSGSDLGVEREGGGRQLMAQELCWGEREHYQAALRAVGWSPLPMTETGVRQEEEVEDDELLVVAADCVYWESLYVAFFQTLLFFTSLDTSAGGAGSDQGRRRRVRVIYSHVKRWKKENKFFTMCRKHMHVEVLSEEVAMVPDPISGQDSDSDGEQLETGGGGTSRCNDESAAPAARMRRQITRVYSITAKTRK